MKRVSKSLEQIEKYLLSICIFCTKKFIDYEKILSTISR